MCVYLIAPFIYLKDLTNCKTFLDTYRCPTTNLKHSPQKRLSSFISSVNFYCVLCVHSSRQEQCTCYWLQTQHRKELKFTLEHYVKSLQNSIWAPNQSNYNKSRHVKAYSKYGGWVSSVTSGHHLQDMVMTIIAKSHDPEKWVMTITSKSHDFEV